MNFAVQLGPLDFRVFAWLLFHHHHRKKTCWIHHCVGVSKDLDPFQNGPHSITASIY